MKNTTVMMAVRKRVFMGWSGSRKPREYAMAPRRPPYATMNWSFFVNLTMRNLLITYVRPITPETDDMERVGKNVRINSYKKKEVED